jgi:hypothetical protein
VKRINAITIESPNCEALSIIGCCEDDCDGTLIMLTNVRGSTTCRSEVKLSRQALESLRDGIDSILEYHDDKCLD